MTDHLLAELQDRLGPTGAVRGDAAGPAVETDWSQAMRVVPAIVVYPRSTEDVSAVLSACSRAGRPVVPQGGLTGLTGGAIPVPGCVVVSTDKLAGIEEIDPVSATVTVRAGTTLASVQEAAEPHGLFFPLDLGSRGTCRIGGNLATNAGGNRVLRYGMARELVVSVEAVLADGSVVGGVSKMLKNNTGYDLRGLLIGSEGTLGVITRAVLRLQPLPLTRLVALCGLPDFARTLTFLRAARDNLGPALTSFEVMWPSYYDFMHDALPVLRRPLADRHGCYVLLEFSGFDPGRDEDRLSGFLATHLQGGVLADAVLATSAKQADDIWAVREAPSEYGRILGPITAFDISFEIPRLQVAVDEIETAIRARWPSIVALFYGHIGDGNLHVVAHVPGEAVQPGGDIAKLVYDITARHGGSISAEHGVGMVKKPYLPLTRTTAELAAMGRIKHALDPARVMNPGKLL